MRAQTGLLVLALSSVGCATTVHRLDGEFVIDPGPARTQCEKQEWLVLARTRYEVIPEGASTSQPRDDGAGLYRVGSTDQESITALKEKGVESPIVERKIEETSDYDRDRIIAASLGGLSVVGMATGTAVFVGGFGTKTVTITNDGGSTRQEQENDNDGTQIAVGAATVGLGLVLGIVGLVVNPSHADRTEAQAARYAFIPGKDDPAEVRSIVSRHNRAVRERCAALPNDQQLGEPAGPSGGADDQSPWHSGDSPEGSQAPGAPDDGAPQDGAPQDGAPQDGAPAAEPAGADTPAPPAGE